MTSKSEYLDASVSELQNAREIAIENGNRGTAMMISGIISDIEDLRSRTENIHGDAN